MILLILLLSITSSKAQSLQDYLDIAKENSSSIQIKNYEYELAKEKVFEIGNNNYTSFNMGYFV